MKRFLKPNIASFWREISQRASAEQTALEQRLATPLPPAEIADVGRRLKAVGDELAALEDEWLRLSGEIEAIEQTATPA